MSDHRDRDSERGRSVTARERGHGKAWRRRAGWTILVAVIAATANVPGLMLALDANSRVERLRRDMARLQSDVADLRGAVGYLLAAEAPRERNGEPRESER